jgi:hypothetical protein
MIGLLLEVLTEIRYLWKRASERIGGMMNLNGYGLWM